MNKITIIAEAGINHNGKIKNALKMVDLAAKAGADFVKFQTFDPNALVTDNVGLADYQKISKKKNTQLKLLNNLKLSKNDFKKIIKRCRIKKIKFLSSPFDIDSIKLLNILKLKIYKIPSGEINNIPYLRYIGSLKKKIILSTGMSNINEVQKAIKILCKSGTLKKNISILHCSTEYPANIKNLNLLSIKYLKDKTNLRVGYSDHSHGYEASLISLAYGARVFEKHFTLNKFAKGPDHKASLSPRELKEYVKKLKLFSQSIGRYQKKPYREEIKISMIARKQIVALKKILKGEKFTYKNITTKRAKKGISANNWDNIIGKISKYNFVKNQNIKN
tara:strand:- start:238 stop:1239 length:1002 start_codon:yes stop_codon:yes gene_type:complete